MFQLTITNPTGSSPAYTARRLPEDVCELLLSLRAPARLAADLRAVHDVAWQLTGWLAAAYAAVSFDRAAVVYGAAVHDIGKVVHVDELSGPGTRHEHPGYALLIARGVPEPLARFARTHGTWTTRSGAACTVGVWRGRRVAAAARAQSATWGDTDDDRLRH
jgi:hypothetical protein